LFSRPGRRVDGVPRSLPFFSGSGSGFWAQASYVAVFPVPLLFCASVSMPLGQLFFLVRAIHRQVRVRDILAAVNRPRASRTHPQVGSVHPGDDLHRETNQFWGGARLTSRAKGANRGTMLATTRLLKAAPPPLGITTAQLRRGITTAQLDIVRETLPSCRRSYGDDVAMASEIISTQAGPRSSWRPSRGSSRATACPRAASPSSPSARRRPVTCSPRPPESLARRRIPL